ncbi:hypothetical protein PISMIDRAFT_348579 [Pisolithus microcarpus 441]|uniref:Uncharacterized protein n=1 Tax=Pisolithus microcarpus 441 TaxID=765257 RepID=A0A0C9YJZ9_9AGAM|nr:hypothetical protein PISMIDRAFT_348579 [Pisolithus microcarpus 441]
MEISRAFGHQSKITSTATAFSNRSHARRIASLRLPRSTASQSCRIAREKMAQKWWWCCAIM